MSSAGLARVSSLEALLAAVRRAAAGKRHQTEVAAFLMDAEPRCLALGRALRLPSDHSDAWRPSPGHPCQIRDPKPRLITVVPFADRVVHQALCAEIEPAFERYAVHDSYACRFGKGQHSALRRAQAFARRWPWCLKGDIARYFASIPHERLLALVGRRVKDAGLRDLVGRVVRAPSPHLDLGRGLPVGALTSQHLANLYLGQLDHHAKDDLGWKGYLRYMDDFLVFGERDALRVLLDALRAWLDDALGLSLNERISRVMPVRDGVPFLGWRVFPDHIVPRPASRRRWRRRILATERARLAGTLSDEQAAASLSASFAHLSTFDTWHLRRRLLGALQALGGGGPRRLQPRETRRFLEQQPAEPALRESQQEQPDERQQQPRVPPGQHGPWPEGGRPWMPSQRPVADPVPVPCPAGLVRGRTEAPPPGGGPLLRQGVAAGHP